MRFTNFNCLGTGRMMLSRSKSRPQLIYFHHFLYSIVGRMCHRQGAPSHRQRGTRLFPHAAVITVGINGSVWLVLNKMAHVAELALAEDQQRRGWSFLAGRQELSLKG